MQLRYFQIIHNAAAFVYIYVKISNFKLFLNNSEYRINILTAFSFAHIR